MVSSTVPSFVNFSALESRFFNICSSLSLSVSIRFGDVLSATMVSAIFFSLATAPNNACISSAISCTATSSYSSCILPASIFERSSISSISDSKPLPELCITFANSTWSAERLVSLFSASRRLNSNMEFNGVRNSCDILARNSDLYLVLCASSSALRCTSSFFSVIWWFFSSSNADLSSSSSLACCSSSCCTLNSSSDACNFSVCTSSSELMFSNSLCCACNSSDCACVSSSRYCIRSKLSAALIPIAIASALFLR